jgi:hypothetical protein
MGEKAQSVSMRLGVNILDKQEMLWPTGRLHALPPAPTDPTTLQPMPTNACSTDKFPRWFVPVSKSQPFLDFFVLIPEKNGKWQFRAIDVNGNGVLTMIYNAGRHQVNQGGLYFGAIQEKRLKALNWWVRACVSKQEEVNGYGLEWTIRRR